MISCVVIRKSTGAVVNNNYSITEEVAASGPEVLGLEPDLQVLIKYEPFTKPEPDYRYYTLERQEPSAESMTGGVDSPHPTYPLFSTYPITWVEVARPVEEIKEYVLNAEQDALNAMWRYREQMKLVALGVGVLFRRVEGMALTTKEQAIADKCVALALKIWKNDAETRNKLTALDAGEKPDLESGYDREPVV